MNPEQQYEINRELFPTAQGFCENCGEILVLAVEHKFNKCHHCLILEMLGDGDRLSLRRATKQKRLQLMLEKGYIKERSR